MTFSRCSDCRTVYLSDNVADFVPRHAEEVFGRPCGRCGSRNYEVIPEDVTYTVTTIVQYPKVGGAR